LRRFWAYLDAAEQAGRRLSLVRNDREGTCRRRIEGYRVERAGGLLDVQRALSEVEDGMVAHAALIALGAGDPLPLRSVLDEAYALRATLVLGFTRSRDLILKPELAFVPRGEDVLGVKFVPRRFSRDELRVLLARACGLS